MFETTSKSQKRSGKGFTLIELLVVVVIVGILAAVALPNFLGQSGKARTTEASAAIDAVKSGEEAYVNDAGSYIGLGTLGSNPSPTANGDGLGGTLVATGGSLSSFSSLLGVTLDSSKFADNVTPAVANGAKWVVATSGTGTTNLVVNVDGGGTSGTGPIKGLGASYQKTQAKIFIDGNATI